MNRLMSARALIPWLLSATVAAAWLLSAAGLDPTNAAQAVDFRLFHFPTIKWFSEQPLWIAVQDYEAAPYPLFYVIFGFLFGLVPDLSVLRLVSLASAAMVCALAAAYLHRRQDGSPIAIAAVLATILISPYFRGPTVYVNTDILPILFFLAALLLFDATAGRRHVSVMVAVLAVASLAFYVRQFYIFAPAYLFLRCFLACSGRSRLVLLSASAVLALPALYLLIIWSGPTPPSFQRHHVDLGNFPSSLLGILANFAVYAAPLLLASLCFHRQALARDLLSRGFVWGLPAIVTLAVLAFAMHPPGLGSAGGGLPVKLLNSLPLEDRTKLILLTIAAVPSGGFVLYLIRQNPVQNMVLALFLISLLPTSVLYQRYFDPILPMLLLLCLDTRESRTLAGSGLILLYPVLEISLSFVGLLHYG